MSFFNRKQQNLIPPVAPEPTRRASPNSSSPRPPPRSSANTYVRSRDGDPYNNTRSAPDLQDEDYPPRERYGRNTSVGDVYSRGGGQVDEARNELFSGYNPEKATSGRFLDGPQLGREPPPGEENDEDVEGIKQQTRFVKQESVNSTRNALRLAREAEETARNTLTRLGDQSEKLANTERHLDVSKGHSARAADKTDELKKLNRSIFRPAITFNKDAKRAAQEAKVQARYDNEREEREKSMMDIRESQNRIGRAATYGRGDEEEEGIGGGVGRGRFKTEEQQALRKDQRKRYQFEATGSDDDMENELDDNLDEISDMTKRLKALGSAMGQELDSQNTRLDRLEGKTVTLDNHIYRNTERLKRIK